MKGALRSIGREAVITALVKRLERRGLIQRTPPLTEVEVMKAFNKIRNAGRGSK
jgi:hypothetical protein